MDDDDQSIFQRVFWCIYQKRCHDSSGQKESEITVDTEKIVPIDKSSSTVQQNYASLTNAENLDNLTNNKTSLIGFLKICGISTDCCPIQLHTKTPDNTVRLNSPSKQYGTNSLDGTVDSIQESKNLEAVVKKSPVSLSPSIANRRHLTPPPHLLTSSFMATSPPVETQLYHIQPKEYVFNQACKPMPSSLMLQNNSLGTFTLTPTQLLHSPLILNTSADVLHSHCTPCESQSAPCSQTLITAQPLPLLNSPYNHVTCLNSDTVTQELNQSSCTNTTSCTGGSTQVPKTYPGIGFTASRRARSKGLLESRRGSRTSLTLSLSPSIDSPTPSYSVGSAQFSVFGGSLDEDPCTAEVLSEENESGNNIDSVNNINNSNILHNNSMNSTNSSKQVNSRCNYSQSLNSFSHTKIISKQEQKNLTTTISPLTSSSSTCNNGIVNAQHNNSINDAQIGLINKGQYFVNNRCNYMCFHHHHHHHHHRHHFHHFAIHHCKLDTGFPCSLGNLTCQRNRDLEQLINASLPLTYDQLKIKLRDNSTALFQEFWDIPMNHADKKELPIPGICHKNRYQSILPNFSTRVILPVINNDITSSYINANYIKGYKSRPNAFIATQGVMPHTINDFWRMVWYSRAPTIVMITKLVENKEVKCELYLPDSSGEEDVLSFVESQSFTTSPLFKSDPCTPDSDAMINNINTTTITTTTTTTTTTNNNNNNNNNNNPLSSVTIVATNATQVPDISTNPLLQSLSSPFFSQSSTSSYHCEHSNEQFDIDTTNISSPISTGSIITTTAPIGGVLRSGIDTTKHLHDSGIASVDDQSSITDNSNVIFYNNKYNNNITDNQNSGKSSNDRGINFYQSISLPGTSKTFGNISVSVLSLERHDGYIVRHLRLTCGTENREVIHFWYVAWPDHSSPEATASVRSLIELVQAVEACRKNASSSSKVKLTDKSETDLKNTDEDVNFTFCKKLPDSQCFHNSSYRPKLVPSLQKMELDQLDHEDAPIIVHCSAGLGRTGCFIALCIGCEQLEKEGIVDVLKIVSRMRLDRGGMVQSNEQYEFIHHVLAAYPLNKKTVDVNHSHLPVM
ncbi:unnamed protein product [Schistosoma rodhaini]|uniref:protein-tyrosine-phosphatase n=1 Tax=Schistosoma rodhaini TaxID=6188 RepID=A0AA85G5N7_9TREM|nr:unnamed protein product [Schistosoma rodhaini]CAH8599861.1 unnamed protein product [Schistosoma rodhaini]